MDVSRRFFSLCSSQRLERKNFFFFSASRGRRRRLHFSHYFLGRLPKHSGAQRASSFLSPGSGADFGGSGGEALQCCMHKEGSCWCETPCKQTTKPDHNSPPPPNDSVHFNQHHPQKFLYSFPLPTKTPSGCYGNAPEEHLKTWWFSSRFCML